MNNYELNELKIFARDIERIETAVLPDRKDAAKMFKEYWQADEKHSIEHFKRSVNFLIDGSYGHGAYLAVRRLSKKMNRKAWIFVTVAQLEWQCPNKAAREAWKQLPADLQDSINSYINSALTDLDSERKE